jgi:hypothetical protein
MPQPGMDEVAYMRGDVCATPGKRCRYVKGIHGVQIISQARRRGVVQRLPYRSHPNREGFPPRP